MINLGRKMFFDNSLSLNNTRSCGTCHNPEFAFTDSYKKSTGIYADETQRNSRPLFNLQSQQYFTAADSTLHSLEQQMRNPLFRIHPQEMGMTEMELVQRVASNNTYVDELVAIYPKAEQPVTADKIIAVIAAYVNSITSFNSKYDKYKAGKAALTLEELNGLKIFEQKGCGSCHGGSNFDKPTLAENYFNVGLYNTANEDNYPTTDKGLYELTKQPKDIGKFKVPTLRNLGFTAPYYHDGSEASLMQVIENYNRGGRQITIGADKGDGALHANKHQLIKPLNLTNVEKKNLLLFLNILNDSSVINK